MFWTNKKLDKQVKQFDWGAYPFIRLGEYGRGRKPINICTTDLEEGAFEARQAYAYDLIFTKTGNLKFAKTNTGIFIAIDTMGTYSRSQDGFICVADKNKVAVLKWGWGAFGDAGRLARGDAAVLQCQPGTFIKFAKTGEKSEYVYVKEDKQVLYFANLDELNAAIDNDIVPFSKDQLTWVELGESDVKPLPAQA